jgi:hypothetical protein
MKKYYLIIITLLFGSQLLKAQLASGSYSDYFREGTFLLMEENYDMALKNFLQAYKLDSSSANINYNVGICYLNSPAKKNWAEKYLTKSITNIAKNYNPDNASEKGAPPLAYFYYGKALHLNYKFDEANTQYDYFEKNYAKDKTSKEDVAFMKMQTAYAKELVAAPINVKVENLGDSINSEYPDFSPVLSADERMIIYTTRRNTSTGGEKALDGQYYEDIVVSYKDDNNFWSKPKPVSEFINTNGNEASINLTPDGQTLIVYQDIGTGGGDVFFSTWDGKDWSSLQQFGSDVNTKYWETHACLSADNNTLYFVSDRPGGFGGRDIYRCVKLPNGKWSLAQNCGPTINTKYDEDGPFIHPDGITLIFSSNGHKTMGGFDIFVSIIEEDKKFSEPFNMGYPINTPGDDVFFVTSPDGKRGYFSSSKEGGFGEKDIYMMFIPDAKEKPLALFKGSILPADGEKLPDDLEIIVTNKETGEIVGRYRPKANGTFSTILPPNKNYNFSYQSKGEEFYNEDLYVSNDVTYQEIKKEINLEPVNLLGKVKVKERGVVLNTIVLNNPKDKQPVPNAKVTLTEKGGADTNFDVDAKGKKDGTPLVLEKLYVIVAEANGKKSAVNSFNTVALKGTRSITQVLYIDGKPAKTFDLFLNVLVVNGKRKPLANSNVTLTGNDGSNYKGVTDAKGRIKGIELSKDVNYDILGENGGVISEKVYFTTMNVNAKKVYEKTLVIDVAPIASNNGKTPKTPKNNENDGNNGNTTKNNGRSTFNGANTGCGSPVNYGYYFAYDKNEVNEANDWNSIIDAIVAKTKECNPVVKIMSSASQVPTHAFSSNRELAKSRAENLEAKIRADVAAKGGDASKIEFKVIYQVRGPVYEGDYQNTEKYGKFQYVKVMAK